MKNYNIILFDLDGTVTDSGLGITKAAAYALNKFNIHVDDLSSLNRFVGPPLDESFISFYGMDQKTAVQAVAYFREYYEPTGIFENEMYEGMIDVFKQLTNQGKTLVLATSKPELFALQIAQRFQFSSFFSSITGSSLDGSLVAKKDVIQKALKRINHEALDDVLMIGDRYFDIDGANAVGIDSMGVLYGYGHIDEFSNANYVANEVSDIASIILENK